MQQKLTGSPGKSQATDGQSTPSNESIWHRLGRRFGPAQKRKSGEPAETAQQQQQQQQQDGLEYAESQHSVRTLELFKYATRSERLSIGLGILSMWYAASWQPISVFILAIMASLMGQYSKQAAWLHQLDNTSQPAGLELMPALKVHDLVEPTPGTADYGQFTFLEPLHALVGPIFDNLEQQQSNRSQADEARDIENAVHDIIAHESQKFLKRSFEINGSAFLLALSQLLAFFIGVTLITRAARRQASRIKVLYFRSCLHQEVTWFEAIDSAGGAGSSLNALVERYEDGIGLKLALLSYFLGHVGLFALTAFYQMASLASFCMPFVAVIGLLIGGLSGRQARAVGEHALFAKRSLQLAEEIVAAVRTVFAFNGQTKELARYSASLTPVYRKSLVKHLYTAFNTSLSKMSIFACFSAYCFYAMRLFPPYAEPDVSLDRAVVLAVMRGAEVSIVNILISIPFLEALQQSRGSIARIYAAIERRSRIDPSAPRGSRLKPDWLPSISFRLVSFSYAERSGPSQRRRSTLPFLNLAGSPGSGQALGPVNGPNAAGNAAVRRRQSIIEELADELDGDRKQAVPSNPKQQQQQQQEQKQQQPQQQQQGSVDSNEPGRRSSAGTEQSGSQTEQHHERRGSLAIRRLIGAELGRTASKTILSQLNLDIAAGQSVALVGPSGSGKSTVLWLIQRLYDTTSGELLLGGRNIKDLNVAWLRNQIGCVTQEPRLFDMTIAENIMLGLRADEELRKSVDSQQEARIMQQVVDAAKAASAHEFIIRLPHGYNTRVGSAGLQLSGGQKQRIAIARALIRRPKILLLDESTSALDTESEAKVAAALKKASIGRTTITVAHRLATVRHVDLIVVMNQGQAIECGSHEELLKSRNSLYGQMWRQQEASARRRPPIQEVANEPSALARPQEGHREPWKPPGILASFPFDSQFRSKITDDGTIEMDSDSDHWATDDDEDEEEEEEEDRNSSETSSVRRLNERASFIQLWRFVEPNKWSSVVAIFVCLLSGLVLPMNLIAHSYLFSAFAYSDLNQLSEYIYIFGLVMLSFSSLVFIVSFLQILLPGYVGQKLGTSLRAKTMESLLAKPVFYFDMDSNSAGALCDRFNSYVSNIESLAGTRIATLLEACSTLTAGALFGFGQNLRLSLFCLMFALLVLATTIVESRICQREANLQQKLDAQLAHLMADALANIKTIASLNKEHFFIDKFSQLIRQRELGVGVWTGRLRTFLTSLKFVMPAMSWSASMFYGCQLMVAGSIDLQTVFIVCPVVLFAVNDTFRALVFLPELLRARRSIERLYRLNVEFSPQVLQTLTLGQQIEQQNRLHLEQMAAETSLQLVGGRNLVPSPVALKTSNDEKTSDKRDSTDESTASSPGIRAKKSISFAPRLQTDEQEFDASKPPLEIGHINRRLSNLAALPSYMRRKSSRLNSLVPRGNSQGKIEFREVEFAYPNRPSVLVLENFSLNVEPGESVALVGSSGSGKSTCAAILEKFYDYHAGRVTLDGRDLRLVEPNWVRAQIGLVSQEPILLSYTIGDNIRYGDNSRFVTMDEVVEAARTANIHDFIMSLPDKYDTQLASSTLSSSQLSGGQRQRIAIARALVRNAPILIFDEATSALDSRSESIVQDALNKARRGRTSITIAHRLATVKDANKIAVVKEGRVVELGRHEELLKPEALGHYRALWQQQESEEER